MKVTTYTRTLTRRGAWLIATLALLAVLALSACARGGAGGQPGGQGGTGTTGQTTTQTTSATVNDLSQASANLDAIVTAMDSADLDANLDESGKDNATQP